MKTMMIVAAMALTLGVGSTAYASDGGGGPTATSLAWEAANGSARVPATQWFKANAAQRQRLSRTYAGVVYPASGNSDRV